MVSLSSQNLFEDIPKTINRIHGIWLRQLLLQGQTGPRESVPPSGIPPPQEITMNTYIPTHWHSKALSSTSGAKIQFLAVCQLLSLLVKEKRVTATHCCFVGEMCVLCVEVVMFVQKFCPSCLWSVCAFGKFPSKAWTFENQSWFTIVYDDPTAFQRVLWAQRVAGLSQTTVQRLITNLPKLMQP